MKSKIAIAAMLVASMALVPGAQAATDCSEIADDSEAAIPLSESGEAGDVYVDADSPGVYQESNDLSGLQTESGSCVNEDGDTVKYDADSQILPPAAP